MRGPFLWLLVSPIPLPPWAHNSHVGGILVPGHTVILKIYQQMEQIIILRGGAELQCSTLSTAFSRCNRWSRLLSSVGAELQCGTLSTAFSRCNRWSRLLSSVGGQSYSAVHWLQPLVDATDGADYYPQGGQSYSAVHWVQPLVDAK